MKKHIVVVLGHSVTEEGKLVPEQKLRLDKGIDIYERNSESKLLMTGGFAPHFNKTKIPLSEHMKKYVVESGVPERDVLVEKEAFNTIQNMEFCKKVVDKEGVKEIVIVTSDYHLRRTEMIAQHIFGDGYSIELVGVKTPQSGLEVTRLREEKFYKKDKHFLETGNYE